MSSEKFTLKPPSSAPVEDTDFAVSSTAPQTFDPTKPPRKVLNLAPKKEAPVLAVTADGTVLQDVELPPNEELPEPVPEAEEMSEAEAAAAHLIGEDPGKGPNRESYFSALVDHYAEDSNALLDKETFVILNKWIARYLAMQVTAKASVDDFSHAITEKGARIDVNVVAVGDLVTELLHLAQLRDLIKALGLEMYTDAIMLGEIDREFGRAKELESEKSKREQATATSLSLQDKTLTAVQRLQGSIDRLQTTASEQKPSPFRPTRPVAPAAPAPAAPAAPQPPAGAAEVTQPSWP